MNQSNKVSASFLIMIFIVSTLSIATSTDYQVQATIPTDCPADMTHYWKLDTSGPNVDSVGGNDATCSSCPTQQPGKVGEAQLFDGADEVNVADDGTFDWSITQSFTIVFWMKRSGALSGNEVIIGRQGPTHPNPHWWVGVNSGGTVGSNFIAGTGVGPTGGPSINDGNWHYIVAVREALPGPDSVRVYVDAKLVDEQTHDYTTGFETTTEMNIGWLDLSPFYHYNGYLDEVALYDKALSWVEIQYHYMLGLDGQDYCQPLPFGCDVPTKIMPLGDSNTAGHPYIDVPPYGYRGPLYNSLTSNGYYFDFVGSLTNPPGASPPIDPHHEGHGGWTADQIRDNIYDTGTETGWLIDTPADVVLLHIGTNDISGSQSPTVIASEVTDIFNNIDAYESFSGNDVIVIASRIILRTDAKNPETIDLNDAVEDIVFSRIAGGERGLFIVDMENALTYPDDMEPHPPDNVHPNPTGYGKMAGEWERAVQVFLPVCFPPEPPADCPEGMISHWRLDEGFDSTPAGPPYVDSYNGNDAWPVGTSPSSVTGILEGGQLFDRPSSIGLDAPGGDFNWGAGDSWTIEFWMWKEVDCSVYDTPGNEVIVGRDDHAATQLHWWVGVSCMDGESGSAPMLFGINDKDTDNTDGAWITGSTDVTDGVWHHVVALKDGTQTRLYVDGNLEGSATATFSSGLDASRGLNIGYMAYAGSPGYFYTGLLDELAIYNRALTIDEILYHWNEGAGREYCEPVLPPCPEGTVAYWMLDEESGTTAIDSFDGYDGTVTGGTWVSGKVNNALEFDGDDIVDCGDISELNGASAFTIVGWVKQTDNTADERLFDKIKGGTDGDYDISIAPFSSELYFELGNSGNSYGKWPAYSATIPSGEWYHLAAVFDGTGATNADRMKLYVNGIERTLAFTGTIPSTAPDLAGDSFTISPPARSPSIPFVGTVDEVAIFDRALTETEIVEMHLAGQAGVGICEPLPSSCPEGMNSYWKLDEPDGTEGYADFYDGNNGAASGTPPVSVPGILNGAQLFSTGTGINVPGTAYNWAADDSFAVEFWMYMEPDTTVKNNVIIGRDSGSTSLHWWVGLQYPSGKAQFVLRDRDRNPTSGGYVTSTSVLTGGGWHHVVAMKVRIYGIDYICLYVDGELEAFDSSYTWTAAFDSDAPLEIGHLMGADWYYRGMLDELAIYDRALTLDEIRCHYNEGVGRDYCEPCELPVEPEIVDLELRGSCPIISEAATADDLVCTYGLIGSATTAATAWDIDGTPQMILFMPMEGGPAPALLDYSGNNNPITNNGATWDPTGGHDGNGAFYFQDDTIYAGAILPSGSSYTKMAWIKRTGTDTPNILNIISGSTGHAFWANCDGINALGGGHGGSWCDVQETGVTVAIDVWYHAALTYDSATGESRLYKDGVFVTSGTTGANTDQDIYIGGFGDNHEWFGFLDDVRVYGNVLKPEQIAAIYAGGDTIVPQETNVGEVWQAHVTPFSPTQAGAPYPSNTVTILEECTTSTSVAETVTVTTTEWSTTTELSTTTETTTEWSTTTDWSTTTETETETVYAAIEMLSGDLHAVVGTTTGDVRKPAGTSFAAWIDSTAGGVILGMSKDGHFCWDTDSDYIDPDGHPNSDKIPSGSTLVASGGPFVNGPVRYYEINRATENTPAYFAYESGQYKFKKTSDDSVVAALTPTPTNDLFIIQIFTDSEDRKIILIYGLAGRGTLAGALYFADNADSFDRDPGFWIYQWTDGPSGVTEHPDPPETDTYNLVTSG